ncbi:hypothetical protein TRFO_18752 [Tritrichomonas foetus]|uniref:RNA polymerase III RPC4 family protein n=1 Tax=Tritrichomonas foetus TaxID=1144522 RepID=A0A1J4KPP8_9EUKA|nr:hypothetical protein TRFO_18752 [Tritrichomonas foetus]|eukprot:OHT11764.1 hypothetical protein TRFO_18752 [Tritrichomonas foetus]
MADKPPASPSKPLPRFKPSRTDPANIKRKMSNSFSMPNMNLEKKERAKPPPPRKERGPRPTQYIDFGQTSSNSMRKIGEVFHAPPSIPKSKSAFEADADMLEADSNLAVTLPLVPPPKKLPKAGDILAPSSEPKVMLVQIPSALPVQYPNDGMQMEYNPLFAVTDGRIGKLYVHQSGKVTAKIGNITFDVSSGIAPSCCQAICVKGDKVLHYYPVSGNKLKFSIDVNQLLEKNDQ